MRRGSLIILLLASQLAWGSEGQIKHRIAIMKSLGGHMAAIGTTLRDGVGFEQHLVFHAQSIQHLSQISDGIFPVGSGRHGEAVKTRAKPQIWSKPELFATTLDRFRGAATTFAEAVAVGDAATLQQPYRDLARACKGCHDDFRWRN